MQVYKLPNAAASKITISTTALDLETAITTAAGEDYSLPNSIEAVDLILESGSYRWLDDGNTPTSANGHLVQSGKISLKGDSIFKLKMIRAGAIDAVLTVRLGKVNYKGGEDDISGTGYKTSNVRLFDFEGESTDIPTGQFGNIQTAEKTTVIELKSHLNVISALRSVTTVVGSATVTAANSEYLLATTAAASDSAILDSAERGRYKPGHSAEVGIAARTEATMTGDMQQRWGYFDDNDGFYFGQDATGTFVAILKGGTETKTYQSSWNVDKVDGTGVSGLTLDLTKGNIYHIDFSWYGYGVIEYIVFLPQTDNFRQNKVVIHRTVPDGVSIFEPDLPIRAQVVNGTTATAHTLYIAGRQFAIIGKYNPARRVTSEYRLLLGSIGTTFLPLIAFRRKSGFDSISVKVSGFDIITDEDLIVQIRLNPTSLTGASYGTPTDTTAGETALEVDKAATAISGGELIWEGLASASGSGGNRTGFASQDIISQDIVNSHAMVICVRRITGTNATASCVFRVVEEW